MLSKIDQDLIILQLGLSQLSSKTDEYHFRCPICGDSSKVVNKKRGHLYWDHQKQTYVFKCYNCGIYMNLCSLLKNKYPEMYKAFIYSNFINRNPSTTTKVQTKHFEKVVNKDVENLLNDLFESKTIKTIKKVDDMEVLGYVYDRKIPLENVKRLYYCDNFYEKIYKPIKKLLNSEMEFTGSMREDKRIFWIIKNRNNNIVGIQGRSILKDPKIRYLTTKISGEAMIGNIERININEQIYITEGYIDSLFLPNAISLNCASFEPSLNVLYGLDVKHLVFVYDNEPYNENIRESVKKVIDLSIKTKNIKLGVCLFPKELKSIGKDVNQYIQKGIDQTQLINIIKSNTFYGIDAKLKFIKW
jgi:transcription elongation factor Elf1